MIFQNRLDAAHQLARALAQYRGQHPLILAIPRGAVPMGAALARELEGDLDVVLVHKLGAPWNPEYAVGAIDESGWFFVSDPQSTDPASLDGEKARQLKALQARRARYAPGQPPISPQDRIVIVVDDGLATGATMLAALHGLKARHPRKLICAVPVAAPDSLERIRGQADEVTCLATPADFQAVGQFYRQFDQVEDTEVIACLKDFRSRA
ncbi:MAG: phosphoribosyltransferase family protein [Rhodocyclaceae bacterium]|jgi:predicted phosphoribosyltransferase|nr:phosphoribosyltransferase family protein [Rhodocyclaceae bacterium]